MIMNDIYVTDTLVMSLYPLQYEYLLECKILFESEMQTLSRQSDSFLFFLSYLKRSETRRPVYSLCKKVKKTNYHLNFLESPQVQSSGGLALSLTNLHI